MAQRGLRFLILLCLPSHSPSTFTFPVERLRIVAPLQPRVAIREDIASEDLLLLDLVIATKIILAVLNCVASYWCHPIALADAALYVFGHRSIDRYRSVR